MFSQFLNDFLPLSLATWGLLCLKLGESCTDVHHGKETGWPRGETIPPASPPLAMPGSLAPTFTQLLLIISSLCHFVQPPLPHTVPLNTSAFKGAVCGMAADVFFLILVKIFTINFLDLFLIYSPWVVSIILVFFYVIDSFFKYIPFCFVWGLRHLSLATIKTPSSFCTLY